MSDNMGLMHKISECRFKLPATSARNNSSLYHKALAIDSPKIEQTNTRFRSPLVVRSSRDSLSSTTPVKLPYGAARNNSETFNDIFSAQKSKHVLDLSCGDPYIHLNQQKRNSFQLT